MLAVTYAFNFTATHSIPGGLRFEATPHPHFYRVEIEISGMVRDNMQIINPTQIHKIVKQEIMEKYDGKLLNEIYVIPTVEALLTSIAIDLKRKLKNLTKVVLHESENIWATATYELQ